MQEHEKLRMLALYLGAVTLIVGSGGVSVHRHTRGTIDRHAPIFGVGWLASRPSPAVAGGQSGVAYPPVSSNGGRW